ncbi:MBL fold metallo-hydrolase [Klenkia sp. PcliD-1-E]|uniref:MBL fold metallo-hydrolase n=1 Tax=Klenkia sp. PcliD-1-E TaxID=2954492 RepID=UPI00209735C7|nr:MBL fold metallo-hydrolase [Klenkia sp. PcliD-1-E]MCO7221123.1 MBL fold metallo-hydrolase [Klenkia sp. PcliD-1-E]
MGARTIVVDCGNGVAQQMVRAGIDPRDITDVLLTHHHIDHSADLAVLPMISWVNGRTDPVVVAGPPPIVTSFGSLLDAHEEDLRRRVAATGRPDFRQMVRTRELAHGDTLESGDDVVITAAQVNHPPFDCALAYRIDSDEGSVVVSGDTTPCASLVELARGADVLVHEVVHPAAIEQYERGTNAATIGHHLRNNHTMVGDVAAVAQAAGVGTLVLSHLVPHTGVTDAEWLTAVGDGFDGRVLVGADLMELCISTPGSGDRRTVGVSARA